jgi:hypothetical protein
LNLAKKYKLPIAVEFRWQTKEKAAHPGITGRMEWIPDKNDNPTRREQEIQDARSVISDDQLIAFFRAAKSHGHPPAAIYAINNGLDNGECLDALFYTGNEYGYELSVRKSDSTFNIRFGCAEMPLAGDGGIWEVTFNNRDQVLTIKGGASWIS